MLTVLFKKITAWLECARGAQAGCLAARGSAYLVLSGDVSRFADRVNGLERKG